MFQRRKGDRTFIREDAAPGKESTSEDSRLWREVCSCSCACPSSTGSCPPEAPTTTTSTSSTPSCRWVHRTARWAVGGFHLPGGLSHLVHLVDRSKGRQGRTTRLPQGGLVRYILLHLAPAQLVVLGGVQHGQRGGGESELEKASQCNGNQRDVT